MNTLWNYKFWLFSKKVFRDVTHIVKDDSEYEMDYTLKLIPKNKVITSKRFSGYLFKNRLYHDNPGIQNIDKETWQAWKKKELIN